MKVVINGDVGCFGLSLLAIKQLAMRKAKGIEVHTFKRWFGPSDALTQGCKELYSNKLSLGNGYYGNEAEQVIWKDKNIYTYVEPFSRRAEYRADPDLVAVVQLLGDDADGPAASLKIIEIPDGISYHIGEQQGEEWVAEDHQTWS